MFFYKCFYLALLPLAVLAAPTSLSALQSTSFSELTRSVPQGCTLDAFQIPLPAGIALTAGQKVNFTMVGRGTQNYTCNNGGFVSTGAVANLYDVSCLFPMTSRFAPAKTVWSILPKIALRGLSFPDSSRLPVALDHYFITTPGATTGISPVFASKVDRVVVKKDLGIDATNPVKDVQYLKLSALEGQGTLASTVFRLDTAGGQPPATCSAGETKAVQYAAMYYFTK